MGVFGFGLLFVLYQVEELSGIRMAVTYPLIHQIPKKEVLGKNEPWQGIFRSA